MVCCNISLVLRKSYLGKMLVATIVTYNDMPLIKDCIESVRNKVDRIVVIDSKYRDFPGEENYSTDGHLNILNSLDIEILFSYGLDEVEKRNLLFKRT